VTALKITAAAIHVRMMASVRTFQRATNVPVCMATLAITAKYQLMHVSQIRVRMMQAVLQWWMVTCALVLMVIQVSIVNQKSTLAKRIHAKMEATVFTAGLGSTCASVLKDTLVSIARVKSAIVNRSHAFTDNARAGPTDTYACVPLVGQGLTVMALLIIAIPIPACMAPVSASRLASNACATMDTRASIVTRKSLVLEGQEDRES